MCLVWFLTLIGAGGDYNYSKIDELSSLCAEKIGIISFTEAKLSNGIANDHKLSIPGYLPLIRADRNRHGGGVGVYVIKGLPCIHKSNLEIPGIEMICLEIKTRHTKLLYFTIYRPRTYDIVDFCDALQDFNDNVSGLYDGLIYVGDYNCHNNQWCQDDITDREGGILKTTFDHCNYSQLITEPTRYGALGRPACLDLIFTNLPTGHFKQKFYLFFLPLIAVRLVLSPTYTIAKMPPLHA